MILVTTTSETGYQEVTLPRITGPYTYGAQVDDVASLILLAMISSAAGTGQAQPYSYIDSTWLQGYISYN